MRPRFLSSTRISHLALCRRKPKSKRADSRLRSLKPDDAYPARKTLGVTQSPPRKPFTRNNSPNRSLKHTNPSGNFQLKLDQPHSRKMPREKVDQWASSRMVVLTLFKPFQIETCQTQRCAGEAQFSACAIEAQNGSRVSHSKV